MNSFIRQNFTYQLLNRGCSLHAFWKDDRYISSFPKVSSLVVLQMKIVRSNFIFQICLIILFFCIGMIIGSESWSLPFFLFYTNLYIGCASYFKCIFDRSVSIWMLHWFFYLIFFAIFPAVQWGLNRWEHPTSDDDVIKANLILLQYGVLYLLGYIIAFRARLSCCLADVVTQRRTSSSNLLSVNMFLLFSILLFLTSIVALFVFRENLLAATSEIMGSWGPGRLMFQFFIQPLVFFLFYLSLLYVVTNKTFKKRFILLLLIAVPAFIFNFPLGSARFYIITIYFPLIIIAMSLLLNKKYHGVVYTLVILPLLIYGSFLIQVATGRLELSGMLNYIFSGNFDAYENLLQVVVYTDELGVRPSQLFGAFLFFIPRELIDSKVVGTGAFLVTEYFKSGPTNISMPLIGEFYLAFSNIGVIFLAFGMGIGSGFLDVRAKKIDDIPVSISNRDREINVMRYFPLYYLMISFSLILYRGDWMNVFSSASGLFLAFLAARHIVREKGWL